MRDDIEVTDVQEQLRLYGQWLTGRTEVGLSGDEPTVLHASQVEEDHFGEPPRRSRPYLALVALTVVVAAGGFISLTAGDDGNDSATATDQSTVPGDPDTVAEDATNNESANVTLGAGPIGQEPIEEEESSDASTPMSADHDVESGEAGEGEATSDGVEEVEATPLETTPTSDDVGSADEPVAAGSTMAFLTPTDGTSIDMNLGAEFQASPVTGATAYTFTATQNGQELFQVTVDEPFFQMPSRLTAVAQFGWSYESGPMTITVTGHDAANSEIATGSVQVILKAGGGPPRFGPSTSAPPSTTTS